MGKGRLLSVKEVKELKSGTKVWLEKGETLDSVYNNVSKVYEVKSGRLSCNDEVEDKYANIYKDGMAIKNGNIKVYEWIEQPKNVGRLLTSEEVGRLPASAKQYYVEKVNYPEQNGLYKRKELPYFKNDNGKYFGRTCPAVTCGDYKVYEYKEEIIIKEYTTAEVIKELELDTTLEFQALSFGTEKRHMGKFLTSMINKKLICMTESPDLNNSIYIDQKWTLLKPELVAVSFMEASKAFDEGKNIRCDYIGSISGVLKSEVYKQQSQSRKGIMDGEINLSFYKILTGEWFIL